jgi:opacity protein-like surface antigen
MLKAVLVASALVMAALTFSAPQASAAIQPQLGKATTNSVSPVGWRHRNHRHHHHHYHRGHRHHFGHFHRRGFVIGPVYSYGYGGGCGWLRHRAVVTGSPYWWHRYRLCRGW